MHTSLVEGVPQAVLQALMAGLPVVATPSLGVRETGSRGAVIVDPDAIQLADAIRNLLRSPPAPSDEVAFAEWRESSVNAQIDALHRGIAERSLSRQIKPTREQNVDRATVDGFGRQWALFDQSGAPVSDLRSQFEQYFRDFPWTEISQDSVGFDLGCGTGRWAQFVAPLVRTLHCIDASKSALEVARTTLDGEASCAFDLAVLTTSRFQLVPWTLDTAWGSSITFQIRPPASDIAWSSYGQAPHFSSISYYALEDRPRWYRAIWRELRMCCVLQY